MPEIGTYFRPAGIPGIEALHASFVEHASRSMTPSSALAIGHDADNRAAVRAVRTEQLDLVGLGLGLGLGLAHRHADAVLRGLKRHPQRPDPAGRPELGPIG